MATRVIDDTKLQNIAVAIQSKDNGGRMTVDEMVGRIEAIPAGAPVILNPALILWDWEGTKLAEYSREDALALTELPAPNTLPAYAEVDHDLMTFYEWNWDLADAQDWIRKHKNVPRDIGAIFLTTDGENHDYWLSTRLNTHRTVSVRKQGETNVVYGMMQDCMALKSCSLPNGVSSINTYAFLGCHSLKHMAIPKSVVTLQTEAFRDCHSIERIVMPNQKISAWTGVFRGCSSLTSIDTTHWTNFNTGVLRECSSLSKIHIPNSAITIYATAFFNCSCLCDILCESKPTLENVNAFDGLPTNYYIYVPHTDLSWFETETNWSTIYTQGHIVAIEDYIDYLESIGFNVDKYKEAA